MSLALRELLAGPLAVDAEIEGREFLLDYAGYGYVGTLLPARFDHLFMHCFRQRGKRRLFDYYVRLEELWGARDFVSESAVETLETMQRYRHRVPEIDDVLRKVEQAEVVLVNGEGEFVFITPPRRAVLLRLALMEYAQQLARPVFFINAMLSDCPTTGRRERTARETARQLAGCTGVFLRDHASIALARELMPQVETTFVPDALFAWYPRAAGFVADLPRSGDLLLPHPERLDSFGRLDFSRPYICVGGSAGAALDPTRATESYTYVVRELQKLGLPVYLTENDGRDGFLAEVAQRTGAGFISVWTPIAAAAGILAGARLFVSGRYHPSIMASLGGTPCVFLGTTAHKTGSLAALLEYERPRTFTTYPDAAEAAAIREAAEALLAQGDAARARIEAVAARRHAEVAALPMLLERALTRRSSGSVSTSAAAQRAYV